MTCSHKGRGRNAGGASKLCPVHKMYARLSQSRSRAKAAAGARARRLWGLVSAIEAERAPAS